MKLTILRNKVGLLALLFSASFAFGQNATLRGVVKDKNSEAVFGASVVLEGQSKGANTDAEGNFRIDNIKPGTYNVIFRATGLATITKSLEFAANEVKYENIVLLDQIQELQEMVVIGYGTTRTSDLTGAATVITDKNFQKGSLSSPEQLLSGKVAGLKINSNDGSPGGSSTIRMRGGTSISASNDPLIVLDGVPLDNGGIAGASNPLSLINPNDIESFVILKDASATAIFGSRGANGVILITTKKGKDGKSPLKVTFDTKHSLSTIAKYADVLTADEFRTLVNERGNASQIAQLGTANTDWQKQVFHNAYITDNNVSLTGGVKNLPYRLSFGNRLENGVLRTDKFQRNGLSLNMSPSFLNKSLTVELNQKIVQTQSTFANRGALGAAYFDPTQEVRTGNDVYGGYYEWLNQPSGLPNTLAPKNPLGLINQRKDQSTVNRYIGNLTVSYRLPFFKAVKASMNVGTDQSEGKGNVSELATSANGYYTKGSSSAYRSTKGNKLIGAQVNYNNGDKKSKHLIDGTIGYSYQDWYTSSPSNPTYTEAGDSIISQAAANPYYTKNALLSYYARGIYTFNNQIVLNASIRRDGSSRFSPDQRWGLFPSVSAAWIVTQYDFMKKVKYINLLKFRGGYGVTGQQDGIGDYAYIGNYFQGATNAQYAFGGQYYTVFRPDGFDANLKWETTSSTNFGMDLGFFKDRVSLSLDLYLKKTSDLLAVVNVPAGTNFTNSILTNVGSMENKGLEISTNIGIIAKKNLKLDLALNATHNINKVTGLSLIDDPNSKGIFVGGISGGIGNTVQVQKVGSPVNSFFVYQQKYDANGKPIEVGQYKDPNNTGLGKYTDLDAFEDLNGDGIINVEDRYVTKQVAPKWFFGTTLNLTYKKWFASATMRSEMGGTIYNNIHSNNATFQSVNGPLGFLNNVSSLYNVEEMQTTTERQLLSDYYLEKANFYRLDYLSVGYRFDKIPVKGHSFGLTVSGVVQNVFVITKYSGQDPEVGGGIDNNIYPRPRVYSLNLTFDI
ncbi:MAG: SusC/RagA family TonB-linked outer membrane protein [Crocinitomicaceae bacterium]